MARRKTATPRRPGRSRGEQEAWRDLHRKLADATTYRRAKLIATEAVPPHGARFYSNLGQFLKSSSAGLLTPAISSETVTSMP